MYARRLIILLLCLLIAQAGLGQTDSTRPQEPVDVKRAWNKMLQQKNELFNLDKRPVEVKEAQERQILQQNATFAQQIAGLQQVESIIIDAAEAAIPDHAEATAKRLMGPSQFDSRIELRLLDPKSGWQQRILSNAASVGMVIRKEHLEPVTDSLYRINTRLTLGDKYKLCPGQAFAGQPVAGEGTAFLINGEGPRMMTAGHVFTAPLEQYAIIFGYEMESRLSGAYETLIPVFNIYYPTRMIFKDDELDVAIVALDKPTERRTLALSAKPPELGQSVYMIGYPCGLPEKVSLNAGVRANGHSQYFYTSLDAFQGNSGSPVFNMDTHEIIGILVSGEVDFKWNGTCREVNVCRIPYCRGEKVVRIETVREAME